MAKRWVDVNATRRPEPIKRLEQAFALCYLAGYPDAGGSLGVVAQGSNEWTEPDVVRRRYRLLYDRMMLRVSRIAVELEEAVRGDPPAEKQKWWRCDRCKRSVRPKAQFCDQCGQPRPQEGSRP